VPATVDGPTSASWLGAIPVERSANDWPGAALSKRLEQLQPVSGFKFHWDARSGSAGSPQGPAPEQGLRLPKLPADPRRGSKSCTPGPPG